MIELYINGQKADIANEISIPMNYELEKLENPTIIKNNFSKTLELQATPTNNSIFGYYYQLDKITTGSGFDANKRIPFELFRDSDLVESGYLQLNNIKYSKNTYYYEITLYGGLGDFFFNLSYNEEGENKTLADLHFGYGENDEEMSFTMNAETIMQTWYNSNVPTDVRTMGGVINFVPSYNGVYDDFDNDKVLINTNDSNIFPNSFSADGKNYTTINGFGFAELNNEYTEWQMRDLRCYKQRPAIRFRAFLDAVCNPVNNGGYNVVLDKKYFFHTDNPYYNDTWVTLPLLNANSEAFPQSTTSLEAESDSNYYLYAAYNTGYFLKPLPITFSGNSQEDIDRAGGTATIDVQCDFSLVAENINSNENVLLLSRILPDDKGIGWSGIGVWLEAVDNNDNIVAISDCLTFVKGMWNRKYKGNKLISEQYVIPDVTYFNGWYSYNDMKPKTNYQYIDGSFIKEGNKYVFMAGGQNTFSLKMEGVINYGGIKLQLRIMRWFSSSYITNNWSWDYKPYLYTTTGDNVEALGICAYNIEYPNTTLNINSSEKTLQDTTITKQQLLKNTVTPASLLTSYTKLFGLYFEKDITTKTITISTRNRFFEDARVIDIDDKIDWNKEVKIEPLMFNKKWYLLTCPALETTQMKNYMSDYYEAEYGQKKINTNYNFNTDVENIYKENKYQNVITMLDSSKYYRHFPTINNNSVFAPAFANDGLTYKLFNGSDITDIGEKVLGKYDVINKNISPVQWTNLVGVDAMPKLCCFNVDNNQQSLNDLNVSLVFFNGFKYLEDSEGNPINYTISNDLPLMQTINEGTPTYLFSNSNYDINNNKICEITNALPQFTRYNIEGGNVVNSLDFGLPFESYINENYTEESTLYNKFWKNFYMEQFNQNTRKITAYVKFDNLQLNGKALKNFYFFNNCYWLLNKIVDYNIAYPYQLVKCEFIKVNNISNYTNGQILPPASFTIEAYPENNVYITDSTGNFVGYGGNYYCNVVAEYGVYEIHIYEDNLGNEITNRCWNSATGEINIENITGNIYITIYGNDAPINVKYVNDVDGLIDETKMIIMFRTPNTPNGYKTVLNTTLDEDKTIIFNPTFDTPTLLRIQTNSTTSVGGSVDFVYNDGSRGGTNFYTTPMYNPNYTKWELNINPAETGYSIRELTVTLNYVDNDFIDCWTDCEIDDFGDIDGGESY